MLVTITSEAYKGIKGYCRDSAFTAADPEQPILIWATENDMNIGENEKYTVLRKDAVGTPSPQQDEVLLDEPNFESDLYDTPNVTLDVTYNVGMVVDVTIRGTVVIAGSSGFVIDYDEDERDIDIVPNYDYIKDIKVISKPLPPVEVGRLYTLEFTLEAQQFMSDGVYILSADNEWLGLGRSAMSPAIRKDHPDIKTITKA